MSKARQQANLSSDGNLFADISNDRVGVGSVVPTHKLHVNGTSKFDDDVKFEGTTAAKNILWDKSGDRLKVSDDARVSFGGANDLDIYHTTSGTSWIRHGNTSEYFVIEGDQMDFRSYTNSHYRARFGTKVELRYNNTPRFETTNTGAKVTGNLEVTGVLTYDDVTSVDSVGIVTARAGVKIPDGQNLTLGTDGDVGIKHQSGHFEINNATGNTYFQTNGQIRLRGKHSGSTEEMIIASAGGSVELYHDNVMRLKTETNGIYGYGTNHHFLGQNTSGNSNCYVEMRSTGTAVYTGVIFKSSDGTTNSYITGYGGGAIMFYGSTEHVWSINNSGERMQLTSTALSPRTDGQTALGTTSKRWGNVHADAATINGTLTATTLTGALSTTDACQTGDLTILNGNPDLRLKDSNHGGNNTEHMIAFQDSSGNNQMNIGSPFGEQHLRIKHGTTDIVKIQTNGDVIVRSADAGASGPTLKLFHDSASPADNDTVGVISMSGDDDGGNETEYAAIKAKVTDVSNGVEQSHLSFYTRGLTSWNEIFRLNNRSTASAPSYTTDDINGVILDVYNTGNPYPRYMNFIAKSGGDTDTNIGFWTEAVGGSPTEKLRLKSGGEVRIGANSTTASTAGDDLVIEGSSDRGLSIISGTSSSANIYFGDSSDADVGRIAYQHNDNAFDFHTNAGSTAKLRITSAGNIGINQTAPTSQLHIQATSDDNPALSLYRNSCGGDIAAIVWKCSSGSQAMINYRGAAGASEGLQFYSAGTGSSELRMILDLSGNLGLGTNDPSEKVHILKSHNGHTRLVVQNNWGSNATAQLKLVSPTDEFQLVKYASGDAHVTLSNSANIKFYIGGNERLRIDSTGRLSVGEANFTASNDIHIKRANAGGDVALRITNNTNQNSGSTASLYFTTSPTQDFNTAYVKAKRDGGRLEIGYATNRATVVVHNNNKVGIARTTNSYQLDTSGTPSDTGCDTEYDLSINRECFSSTNAAFLGLNKTLNVDNQYTVSTFRSENVNRNGTTGWMDVAKFWAWDMNARVIIQAGGTFTGDQIDINVQSSYNSALANGRSGPILEVKRTEGHNGGRFTKVRVGCHNSNRQPVLQVYFVGSATHNALGTVNVTCHDYGSNYGGGSDRGEARFQSATTLNETWEEVDIGESGCDYFNTSTTPAFSAYKSDNSGQISSGTYAFNSQILDRGGDNYNTSNGRFTAPCDGVYYFIATLQMYGGSGTVHARFQKNGTDVYNDGTDTPYYDEKHSSHANLSPFCLVELSTDDYVECVRNGNTRGMQSAVAGFLVR